MLARQQQLLPHRGRWREAPEGARRWPLARPLIRYVDHHCEHAIQIAQNVASRNSKRLNALFMQPCVAAAVVIRSQFVGFAVHLNTEPSRVTVEIQDIRSGRMLSTKVKAGRIAP